jgi:glycosyltransferase involved in cell wall biosynthesis
LRVLAVGNMYPPHHLGGYELVWQSAVRSLRADGHTVRVLTTDFRTETAEPDDPEVHRELRWYWRDHDFPRLGLRETVALERANAAVLARHLERLNPHVVLWWAMGGMSLSLLEQVRQAGVPAVGVVGDDWMAYAPAVDGWTRRFVGWRRPAAPIAERLAGVPTTVKLARAARWVFVSDHIRARARTLGVDGAVAHPGVDLTRFTARPSERWHWRLLYCGRIDPRKGIRTAIEALPKLPPDATLTIHGDGDRRHSAELLSLTTQLGLTDRVRFQSSAHEQVPDVYAAADAVLFPVRWEEPWGLVPLEAMASGRPVVASRAGGGAAEYLREGKNCLQFPPGDAAALATAVRRLARDAELRARLVAAGAQTAARFTEQAFYDAVERELDLAIRASRT